MAGIHFTPYQQFGNLMIQANVYEALAHLGPFWSGIAAGYAVTIFGVVYITPAGLDYLDGLEKA